MRLKFWEAKDISWDGVWYRIVMRIAHKYHWHYMPPLPVIDYNIVRLKCEWCCIHSSKPSTYDGLEKAAREQKYLTGNKTINLNEMD